MTENKLVEVKISKNEQSYEITIGARLLETSGRWAQSILGAKSNKIVLVTNQKIFNFFGQTVLESLQNAGLKVFVWLMKDGEKYKNLKSLENLLRFMSENQLTRTDSILALGGGVVGDLAGFAAAIYLRGISFLQIPTTLLAMIDSSVGGKTGVNTGFGKNLIGAFHQPEGVLIDIGTLKTLPKRELIAGFCEAVKHGAIANEELFFGTSDYLDKYPPNFYKKHFSKTDFHLRTIEFLSAQIAFKAEIVMNDERESPARRDSKSRKILNFGHTLAHSLEKITSYKYFRHGEAVGYGILFAADLAKRLDILDGDSLKSLNDVMRLVGTLPDTHQIDKELVIQTFAFDKKNIGRELQWVLLRKIGHPIVLSGNEIPKSHILQSLTEVLKNNQKFK